MNQPARGNGHFWPACVGVEEAGRILGWPLYFFPVLIRAAHLKPLGKPMHNARKWFATCELERLSHDAVWLDKAIRIVERHVQESNRKQRSKAPDLCLAPLQRDGVLAASN
ncbi:MAG: hypothetical protein MUF81_19185 [Verrucomicrobia bacterium]|jgi:hypothetical protein|nr:hypothetical protein [Verrucomicrobiota bacterium]